MRYFLVLFFLFLSCSKTENLNNFSLRVEVDGLKKGTLYLEKFSDYDTQFDKAFLDPMKAVLNAIGWSDEKKITLESFFS